MCCARARACVLHGSVCCSEHAVELRRIGCGPPAESWLDAIVRAEMGLNLSGPSGMKGKRAPLVAALTQGGLKGFYRNKHAQIAQTR